MASLDGISLQNEITRESALGLDVDIDKISLAEQVLARFKMDTEFRGRFSVWVMYLIPIWLGVVIIIFFMHGLRMLRYESSEMIALLATTTANVLGLAFIVLKGFFGKGNQKK